jgi:hypothetical protein
MPSNSKPFIAIVGAVSKQGRSVACKLRQSGRYRVRALTRQSTDGKKWATHVTDIARIEEYIRRLPVAKLP